jgi:regulator of replication initiation timing
MAVRSALPWPLRWALGAVVLGFCAAIGLWAFELGKDLAGLDGGNAQEVSRLRGELADLRQHLSSLREERDKAQSVANTSATLLTAEKAAQERLVALNRQLEVENRSLRDDLGFFEKLIPTTSGSANLAIRGLQAELQNGQQIKWQVLVIQAQKNAPEFNGKLELSLSGTQSGRPWSVVLPEGPLSLKFRQYGRLEGVFELPPQTVVKSVSARVMEGSVVRATQSIKL